LAKVKADTSWLKLKVEMSKLGLKVSRSSLVKGQDEFDESKVKMSQPRPNVVTSHLEPRGNMS